MKRERYHWVTRLRVDRRIEGFPEPLGAAESEASSAVYRIVGAERVRETHCAVFQYTLSGRGIFRTGDHEFEVPPGSGFLCRVGDPEICYFYPKTERVPWRFLFFTFRESYGIVPGLTRDAGHVFRIPPESVIIRRLSAFRDRTGQIIEMKAGEGALLVHSLVSSLADLGRSGSTQTRERDWVRRCRSKVDEMLFETCNAGTLAESLGVSPEHLSRVFHKETGETLYRFLLRRKIDQACVMLKESGATCRDVALSLGFEPGSHFARIFRRVVGMTPGEFRERGILGAWSGEPPIVAESPEQNSCANMLP
jgi:AraC-like DNA-binding protein